MEQIKIAVSVPLSVAVENGSSRYGNTEVVLTDQDIQAMAPSLRALLARAKPEYDGRFTGRLNVDGSRPVVVKAATVAGLMEALAEVAAREAKRAAEEEARRVEDEARIERALARPLVDWICRPLLGGEPHVADTLENAPYSDARITARRQAARIVVEEARAAWLAERERQDRETKAREAREAAERAAHDEALRAWVLERGAGSPFAPEIVRAAREKRQVRGAVQACLREQLRRCLEPLGEDVVASYVSEAREGVPHAADYGVLDRLTEAAQDGTLSSAALLPGAEIEIGPIARHDVAPRGAAVWRTGVSVTLSHPWLDDPIEWTVLSEPVEAEQDEYDDED